MYTEMTQWFECSAPEPRCGVELQAGTFNFSFFSTFILFLFLFCFVLFCFVLFCFVLFCFVLFCFVLFCFVLSELDIVKVINCFFFLFFKSRSLFKKYPTMFIKT